MRVAQATLNPDVGIKILRVLQIEYYLFHPELHKAILHPLRL